MISFSAAYYIDILILAVGRLGALLSQLLFMMPWAVRSGYRYRFNIDLTDPHARQIALMAAPVVLGVSVNQLNVVIDKTLASGLAVGGISVLASPIESQLVHGVLVLSVMAVLYPSISKLVVGRDLEKVKELTSNALTNNSIGSCHSWNSALVRSACSCVVCSWCI